MDEPSASPSSPSPSDEPTSQVSRPALLEKARAFLLSPGVRHEDDAAKRRFLEEKGLTAEEIDTLITTLPPQPPPIPPRTYPPPPPSNLPFLLASFFRAFTWIAGTSSILLFGYYRFLLPRLTQSLGARHGLKLHQSELLGRLQSRLDDLKICQTEAYDSLLSREQGDVPAGIKTFADLPVNSAGEPKHPLGVVVRCAFIGEVDQRLTLEDIYQLLLNHFPGLQAADEAEYKLFIVRELSRSKSFEKIKEGDAECWILRQDANSSSVSKMARPPPIAQSLESLRDEISHGRRTSNSLQHTFKSLTDLTAYLSRETFEMYSATTGFRRGLPGTQSLGPAEEDVRREIRALKGLVLNRRTFAPSPLRSSPVPPSAAVSS